MRRARGRRRAPAAGSCLPGPAAGTTATPTCSEGTAPVRPNDGNHLAGTAGPPRSRSGETIPGYLSAHCLDERSACRCHSRASRSLCSVHRIERLGSRVRVGPDVAQHTIFGKLGRHGLGTVRVGLWPDNYAAFLTPTGRAEALPVLRDRLVREECGAGLQPCWRESHNYPPRSSSPPRRRASSPRAPRAVAVPWNAADFPPLPATSDVLLLAAPSYDMDLVRPDRPRHAGVGHSMNGKRVLLKPNMVEDSAARSSTRTRRSWRPPPKRALRAGAREVVVGEGPGHRRDTDTSLPPPASTIIFATEAAVRGLEPRRRAARAAAEPVHGPARIGAARVGARCRRRRLPAEAEDASLGGHDAAG